MELLAAGNVVLDNGSTLGPLVVSIRQLLDALFQVVRLMSGMVWPWFPLALWGAFWVFLVDWRSLVVHLHRGGWGLVLMLGVGAYVVVGLLSTPDMSNAAMAVRDGTRQIETVANGIGRLGQGSMTSGGTPSWFFGWRLSTPVQRLLDAALLAGVALIAGAVQLSAWWRDQQRQQPVAWTRDWLAEDHPIAWNAGDLGRGAQPGGGGPQGIS